MHKKRVKCVIFAKKFAVSDIYRNFALLYSATLPDDQRTRADLFYYGDMSTTLSSIYTKPALSIPDQIRMLKGRGFPIFPIFPTSFKLS